MTADAPREKYDVAFSFLEQDRQVAHELRELLEPTLSVFVYDRHQDAVGGQDGGEAYARVFKHETRLAVVLYRNGWGATRFTGIEEAAIRDRATRNRFRSFMVVMMEPDQRLPDWIPETTVYQHGWNEPRPETAAVIRARAQDVGAVLATETVLDTARRRAAAHQKLTERKALLDSHQGVLVARAEALRIMGYLLQQVAELTVAVPSVTFSIERDERETEDRPGCILVGPVRTLAVWWRQPHPRVHLRDTRLEIGDIQSRDARVPMGTSAWAPSWSVYEFCFTPDGQTGWRYVPDSDSTLVFLHDFKAVPTLDLAEGKLRAFVEANIQDQ